MQWNKLLERSRLGTGEDGHGAGRDQFQRDFDSVIFSSSFRRMQDKTQVFPLAKNDYVRTRLTHSLEVSCVGRSLGVLAGRHVLEKEPELKTHYHYTEADFGNIVASACLIHDIGNPPFGHTGEDAIQEWFRKSPAAKMVLEKLSEAEKQDFLRFEGNAQGFRIATRLHDPENHGLDLSVATLAASIKYPQSAHQRAAFTQKPEHCRQKKHNYFLHDQDAFKDVMTRCELVYGDVMHRHPLAYLVEAADDICYHIIDIEDGFRTGCLEFDEVQQTLLELANAGSNDPAHEKKNFTPGAPDRDRWVTRLRGAAINNCIEQVAQTFCKVLPDLTRGAVQKPLVDITDGIAEAMEKCTALCEARIYPSRPVAGVESFGYRVLWELLELFVPAAMQRYDKREKPNALAMREKTLLYLQPKQFGPGATPYEAVLGVTDYISGMTDGYAAQAFKEMFNS